MRTLAALLGLVSILSFMGALIAQQEPPNTTPVNVDQKRISIPYPVNDLAVWSANGTKFDASILIELLKTKVNPGQWNDKNMINPYADNATIIVTTTQGAHKSIANILTDLRAGR